MKEALSAENAPEAGARPGRRRLRVLAAMAGGALLRLAFIHDLRHAPLPAAGPRLEYLLMARRIREGQLLWTR